jgi:hypothetical protein
MGLFKRRDKAGAFMLQRAAEGNPRAAAMVDLRRAAGVTDEDLLTWWGFSDAHRKRTSEAHKTFQVGIYLAHKDEGHTEAEAVDHARRNYPTYTMAEHIYDEGNLRRLLIAAYPTLQAGGDALTVGVWSSKIPHRARDQLAEPVDLGVERGPLGNDRPRRRVHAPIALAGASGWATR